MTKIRLLTKSTLITLAIVGILAVTMLPSVSAGYGDVRKFLRNPGNDITWGLSQSKLWDVYWDSVNPATGPGRICSIFTLGAVFGLNFGMNNVTSEDSIMIGVLGIAIFELEGYDEKSAKDYYRNFEFHLWLNGTEVDLEVTPYRKRRVIDETGLVIWWEWRASAIFRKGELTPGVYEFRQTFSEYGTDIFDTEWFLPPYYFQIV